MSWEKEFHLQQQLDAANERIKELEERLAVRAIDQRDYQNGFEEGKLLIRKLTGKIKELEAELADTNKRLKVWDGFGIHDQRDAALARVKELESDLHFMTIGRDANLSHKLQAEAERDKLTARLKLADELAEAHAKLLKDNVDDFHRNTCMQTRGCHCKDSWLEDEALAKWREGEK